MVERRVLCQRARIPEPTRPPPVWMGVLLMLGRVPASFTQFQLKNGRFTTWLYRSPTAGPNMSRIATTTIAIKRMISAYSTNPCPSSRGKKTMVPPPSSARAIREEAKLPLTSTGCWVRGDTPHSSFCSIQHNRQKGNSTLGLISLPGRCQPGERIKSLGGGPSVWYNAPCRFSLCKR